MNADDDTDVIDVTEQGDKRFSQFTKTLLAILLISVIAGLIGEIYSSYFYDSIDNNYYQGFRSGFLVGFLTSLFEYYYVRSVRKNWFRRLAFLPSLLVRILIITFLVRVSLIGNDFLTQWFRGEELSFDRDFASEFRDTIFSLALTVFFVAQLQLSSVIGFKRFNNLIAGRYFRPVEEERIFLFVDLIGSTRAARELGDVRFHEYLAEFFYNLDRAIVAHDGEIVSYVGDAVIVTWPLAKKIERNNVCIRTVLAMRRQLQNQSDYFESEFGRSAQFRAALHGGPVVVGECGDSRRQITFLGNVVNMTARIEGACKELGEDFLISSQLVGRLHPPTGVYFESVGEVELRGSDEPLHLYAIRTGHQSLADKQRLAESSESNS